MTQGPARGGPARRPGRGVRSGTDGLVVVDKEAGWTSHDVVARCRRIFGQRRVGHAGTLDPDATGVLLVGLGRCTRLLRFLSPLRKRYRGEVVLGVATSTLDSSGEVVATAQMSGVGLAELEAAAVTLRGEIEQVPPMVSAVKVGGERLHRLARQGVEVARGPRPVTVYRLELSPTDDPRVFGIDVECSSGTYVRVLAADLGEAAGGVAHLRNLRRTAVGSFTEDRARTVETLGPDAVLSPAEALAHLEAVTVGHDVARLVARGLPLDRVPLGVVGDGPWSLLDSSGNLLAVYEGTGTDRITPAVVLAAH